MKAVAVESCCKLRRILILPAPCNILLCISIESVGKIVRNFDKLYQETNRKLEMGAKASLSPLPEIYQKRSD